MPRPFDVALAGVVGVVSVLGSVAAARHGHPARPLDWFAVAMLVVGAVALLWRRVAPNAVLAVTLVATLTYLLRGYGMGPIFLSLVVAYLTAAPRARRWPMYALPAVGFAVVLWLVPWVTGQDAVPAAAMVGIGAWLLTLVAIAEGIRQRREAIRARRQRAREAARSAEEERLRRASEERLDIARELHDVLAHSLSLINVQSGVALELLDSKPEQAGVALASIKDASREALVEVHSMLRTLRRGGELAPLAPAPSVADLDALVERARGAGIDVTTIVSGTSRRLPSAVDLAAARIVQEALTNVARHSGQSAARVRVEYRPDRLEVRVDDDGHAAGSSEGGVGGVGGGIAGMTERAHALGGTLSAGRRTDGGFRVEARLPLSDSDSGEDVT
ncbi:sensor histidine kinase [Rhodococcus spelaei]|uniref:histidine kinase n=1 Tax=Rhodococcus spelaei TaxID=2546320 RepID=A0A541BP39_9NOCA|nr:histidine kinase [Rhodococcus spelaei]TQF74104.1 sensor histidine kinase [Rhodococcus spelaei]